MREIFEIILPFETVSASRPRVWKGRSFYIKTYYEYRERAKNFLRGQKTSLLKGKILMGVMFEFKPPKSWNKKKKEESYKNYYCDNRKDIDNLLKSVMDALQGFYFKDDRQVVSVVMRKIWVKDNPKTRISLQETEEY